MIAPLTSHSLKCEIKGLVRVRVDDAGSYVLVSANRLGLEEGCFHNSTGFQCLSSRQLVYKYQPVAVRYDMLRYLGNLRGGRGIHLRVKNTVEDGGKRGFNLDKHAETVCTMRVSESLG